MKSFFALFIAATLLISVNTNKSGETRVITRKEKTEQKLPCPCKTTEECNDNLICTAYGHATDECGRKFCKKGPGQKCHNNFECATGLMCSNCNICVGCSQITQECFFNSCKLFKPPRR